MTGPRKVQLDSFLGRVVHAGNNRPVGRIEEFHAEQAGDELRVVEVVIGAAGLIERMSGGLKVLLGKHPGGRIARWDQIDLTEPEHPRLRCSVDELRKLEV